MGSRLMHAAIAKQLMTKFSQLDMAFMIGNEAPDVDKISQIRLPWAITHIYWLTRFGLQTSS